MRVLSWNHRYIAPYNAHLWRLWWNAHLQQRRIDAMNINFIFTSNGEQYVYVGSCLSKNFNHWVHVCQAQKHFYKYLTLSGCTLKWNSFRRLNWSFFSFKRASIIVFSRRETIGIPTCDRPIHLILYCMLYILHNNITHVFEPLKLYK